MFQLNHYHRRLIQHRVEIPDALAEALDMDVDVVREVCRKIDLGLARAVHLEDLLVTPNHLRIVVDCVEGSTILALKDNYSRATYREFLKAGEELAEALGCNYPLVD